MKFYIAQSIPLNCIFVRSVGRFNPTHMKTLIASISTLNFYIDDVLMLHDMRLVDFNVDAAQIMDVARADPPQPLHSKLALVAENALGYGMLRMLAAIRENMPRKVAVFRSIEEGLNWLGLDQQGEVDRILSACDWDPGDDTENFSLHVAKVAATSSRPTK